MNDILCCSDVTELAAAYALDSLDPSMAAAVRAHLAVHREGHPEFAELGGIAPAMAYLADPVAPPIALKGRILAAAATTPQESALPRSAAAAQEAAASARVGVAPAAPGAPAAPATPATPFPRPRGADTSSNRRGIFTAPRLAIGGWAFSAVAAIAIVALVIVNSGLRADVSSANNFADQVHRAVAMAAASGSRVAVIAPAAAGGAPSSGIPTGPNGLAVIPAGGSGILVMQGLAATSGSQVYEAWAIVGKLAPAPIGSFAVGGDGKGWISDLAVPPGSSITVALTREPGPGATTPTLPIVALGTAAQSQ